MVLLGVLPALIVAFAARRAVSVGDAVGWTGMAWTVLALVACLAVAAGLVRIARSRRSDARTAGAEPLRQRRGACARGLIQFASDLARRPADASNPPPASRLDAPAAAAALLSRAPARPDVGTGRVRNLLAHLTFQCDAGRIVGGAVELVGAPIAARTDARTARPPAPTFSFAFPRACAPNFDPFLRIAVSA